ncbi:MAG: thiamine diphosphokinase [Armatimonadetes bacterium]|nr:thiamine diphosphokinase [Armatimonadota bacterium]
MSERVLAVLGGSDSSDTQIEAWAKSADVVYAADQAANRLVRLGVRPIVVGDLDSFDRALSGGVARVHEDPDPDRTDADKVFDLLHAEGRRSATVAGLEGDLLDHVLASLSTLARSPLDLRVVFRSGIGHIVRAGVPATEPAAAGRRVSLIPLTSCRGVHLTGTKWDVTDRDMAPAGFLSVSNEGAGPVSARLESGTALLFVGREPDSPPEW